MSPDEHFRVPDGDELERVLRMLTRAYVHVRPDFPDDPDVLGAYGRHDPEGRPEDWVVLWEEDRPISALRLFMRRVRFEDREISIGGIGNVGTDPGASGRGLATRVMREAHRRAVDRGAALALLVTDIPDFYRRLGYAPVPQRELLAERRENTEPEVPARRFTRDVPREVRELHARAAATAAGRVIRDERYWSRWIMDFHVARSELDALAVDGAYLIGRSEEEGRAYRALEGAGEASALGPLLHLAAGDATRLKTPDEPAFRAVLEAGGGSVAPRVRTGIMACALTAGAPGPEDLGGYLELDTF